ncbi:MAG TPA: hypothetical protein P5204_00330 [Kiritimatiellia bacterium]|nr:hypothetical protein [Kiritimatiellia bacterium]
MNETLKIKLTHELPDGAALTLEIRLAADSLDQARAEALRRFEKAIADLAGRPLAIAKAKIEQGA